jgi:hypothetical protein
MCEENPRRSRVGPMAFHLTREHGQVQARRRKSQNREGQGDNRRQDMAYHRTSLIGIAASVLLFAGAPFAQAHGPGLGGFTSVQRAGVQEPFRGAVVEGQQPLPSRSIRGSADLAHRRLHPGTQLRYRQSLSSARVASSQTKPEDTFHLPPAGAPAAEAISSSAGYTVVSYTASYCATPRGACNLAGRQAVGDKCWCITPDGVTANGTAE